ncbi:MAG: glycosyltransferase family 4 protein [Pseudomonadota bacterium]
MATQPMTDHPILIVSVDAFPKMGGISTMTHHMANAFAARPGGAILLAPKGSHVPPPFERHYALAEDFESDLTAREGAAALAEDDRIERLTREILNTERPRRVLLMHAFHYGTGALAAARAMQIPLSVYVHGTEFTSQVSHPSRLRDPSGLGARLLRTLSGADEILTNSHHTASLVSVTGRKASATGVGLPRSVVAAERRNSPLFEHAQRRARRRAIGLPDAPLFGYIGRLVVNKRIDRMFEIARHVPDATCVIGGTGPIEADLAARAKALGIQDRVLFLGTLSEADKWRLLRALDFAFLLSEHDPKTGAYEGFGIAMLEAAAAGAVPVTTGTDGMADFAGAPWHGALRIPATPWQPARHANTLSTLLAQEQSMDALVRRGRRAIDEAFTWEQIARQLDQGWATPQPMELARAG